MRILIVEDEAMAARRLERMVREILPAAVESVLIKESLADAQEYLHDKTIDLLLLDLNLNGEDGYDLLKLAAAGSFRTIVVSANSDRAIEAFQYGVLDFVPKPIDAGRLRLALERTDRKAAGTKAAKYLAVRKFAKVELLPVEQVLFLKGAGDYVEIHMRDGRMELHGKTLENLEAILPECFQRIHKSYVADMRAMKGLVLQGAGKYALDLGQGNLLPVSRTKYKELKEKT